MIRIAAAAAVVVHRGHVLLVRRRNPPDAGLWGYPGGHREMGESAFRTAQREVAEESGLRVVPRRLVAVLPVGRFHLAMISCRHAQGAPRPADDVDGADWFAVRDVLRGGPSTSRHVDTVLRRARL